MTELIGLLFALMVGLVVGWLVDWWLGALCLGFLVLASVMLWRQRRR